MAAPGRGSESDAGGTADTPRASVVIPAHDAAATIGRALRGLAAQQAPGGFEAIVVDDGSGDETAAIVGAAPGPVRLLRQERAGAAAARNAGVAAARSRRIAFLDADCYPSEGWLLAGLRALEDADLVQGAVLPDPGERLGPFDRTLWVTDDSGLYQTANMFLRRDWLDAAGGFEAWIDPVGDRPFGEDVLMAWKVIRSGARPAFSAEALVHHAVFRRSAAEFVAERSRLAYFPSLVRRVPELRRGPLFLRVFLSRRSAAFDLALASLLALALSGWAPAAAGVLPYAVMLGAGAAPWRGRRALAALIVGPLADLRGLVALLAGSLRRRRVVL